MAVPPAHMARPRETSTAHQGKAMPPVCHRSEPACTAFPLAPERPAAAGALTASATPDAVAPREDPSNKLRCPGWGPIGAEETGDGLLPTAAPGLPAAAAPTARWLKAAEWPPTAEPALATKAPPLTGPRALPEAAIAPTVAFATTVVLVLVVASAEAGAVGCLVGMPMKAISASRLSRSLKGNTGVVAVVVVATVVGASLLAEIVRIVVVVDEVTGAVGTLLVLAVVVRTAGVVAEVVEDNAKVAMSAVVVSAGVVAVEVGVAVEVEYETVVVEVEVLVAVEGAKVDVEAVDVEVDGGTKGRVSSKMDCTSSSERATPFQHLYMASLPGNLPSAPMLRSCAPTTARPAVPTCRTLVSSGEAT